MRAFYQKSQVTSLAHKLNYTIRASFWRLVSASSLGPPRLELMSHTSCRFTATPGRQSNPRQRQWMHLLNFHTSEARTPHRSCHTTAMASQHCLKRSVNSSLLCMSASRSAPACSHQLTGRSCSSYPSCHHPVQHALHTQVGRGQHSFISGQRGYKQRTKQRISAADATTLDPSPQSPPDSETITSSPAPHEPVLLQEVLEFFSSVKLGIFIDGTLGAGGHSAATAAQHQVSSCTIIYTQFMRVSQCLGP